MESGSLKSTPDKKNGGTEANAKDYQEWPGVLHEILRWKSLEEAALNDDQEMFQRDRLGDPLQGSWHIFDGRCKS